MNDHLLTLNDHPSGAQADFLLGLGVNCFRFKAMAGGTPVEVLYAPPGFESGTLRPSSGGIPILFPFPGRLRGTRFDWEGRHYEIPASDGRGNAIHGFVHTRPWRLLERERNRFTAAFQAWRDDPTLKSQWPADFQLTVTYELAPTMLRATIQVENPGETPLPCGLGLHPYFRIPLGGSSAADCVVRLPVTSRWELREMLPTGQKLPLDDPPRWHAGQPFGALRLDDVFGDLVFEEGLAAASLSDPQSGHTITCRFDAAFRECVVYTPPHREAICIEPYTCVPNAAELASRGIDAGLRIVPPGERFTAHFQIEVG